jgi:hypothetical protein
MRTDAGIDRGPRELVSRESPVGQRADQGGPRFVADAPGGAQLPVAVPAGQGWRRREACEARGADFDASDGGARRRFEIGGVRNQNIYIFNVLEEHM